MIATMHVYHPHLLPTQPVSVPPSREPDVVLLRCNADGSILQEIYQRPSGIFGVRYRCWVNLADAGGGAHHLWETYLPDASVFTDSVERAKEVASAHAQACGIVLREWSAPLSEGASD